MEEAAAPSVIVRIAHVGPANMRKCFSPAEASLSLILFPQ